MMLIVAAIGAGGAAGVLRAADARTSDVERIDGLEGVLADLPDDDVEYPAENYLLVGSDSREGIVAGTDDYDYVGDTDLVAGRRSDTIMVLRQERNGGAALMSLPRDLWVEIAGTGENQRINTAYNEGPERLAATVSQSLGIPIHHYVEVDFLGFKDIVDEIGGVEVCTWKAARDIHSGLALQPGCQVLDGDMALAYARSRYYEEWDGEDWVTDPRADLGRIDRQQFFIRAAVDGMLHDIESSPFKSGDTIQAVTDSVRIDPRLNPIKAAQALRQAAQQGLHTYALPVENDTVGDAAILRLGDGADELLAYFSGQGPAPAQFETVTDPALVAASDGA
jgi:LCP family protein required for cell wall assembly